MKSPSNIGFVEPLESRIAPAATIFMGAPDGTRFDTPKDTEYVENNPSPEFQTKFFTKTATSNDLISVAVRGTSTKTFFFELETGDEIQAFKQGGGYGSLVKVSGGKAVAFFTDLNGNNDYDDGEFSGLALGKDAKVVVSANLRGDIATNLDEKGTATTADDTISMTGLVSEKQGIALLDVAGGSVFGSVYSGGDIKSIHVAGDVQKVLAGNAANGATFNYFSTESGGKGTLAVTTPVGFKGASISNASFGSVSLRVQAGDGGIGAAGGSLTNIQVVSDTDGFQLVAGAGGNGDAGFKKTNGGPGGGLTNIYVGGAADSTPNSLGGIVLKAGAGGDGLNTGSGGAGGKVSNIFVGYELNGKTAIESGNLLADNLLLAAGAGGAGKSGGLGGSIGNTLVKLQTPDLNGDEIVLSAGDGGNSLAPAGGRAGVGGSITGADVRNQTSTFDSDTVLRAGDAGTTVGAATGAAGGSILKATVLGFDVQVLAGDGSTGKSGGNGGSITTLTIADGSAGLRELVAHNVLLNAGKGGNGIDGNGGSGGSVLNITGGKLDTQVFLVNTASQGNGGDSLGGKGGAGGAVGNLLLIDGDTGFGFTGDFNLRAGNGGSGSSGGGTGGALQKALVTSLNAHITAAGGLGGNALTQGRGGNGGLIASSDFTAFGSVNNVNVFGRISAGAGGKGIGRGGAGGLGGNVQTVNVDVEGAVTILSGNGGDGDDTATGGAAGRGGNIQASAGFGRFGAGELRSGSAGLLGAKPGVGGSILGAGSRVGAVSGLLASTTLTIVAGDGSGGGQGGDVKGIVYGSTAASLQPTPSGNILVRAGNGSAEGKTAGKGGVLDGLFGSVSSGAGSTTQLIGGDGGSGADKAGAGGSVSNVEVTFGGGANVAFTIKAGDAGDAANAARGEKGGDVRGIFVSSLDDRTIFRSVAAGDGGDASKTGGLGGTIDRVSVSAHDIGVRTGQVFGYNTMGGLFAGVGGKALGSGGSAGLAGSVTSIEADSIAAIVAGRASVPQFAEKVEKIYLNGDQKLSASSRGFRENGPFTLSYFGQTTAPIAKNATRTTVQAELNALSNISTNGGVTVADGPIVNGFPTYNVVWNTTGDRLLLSGTEQQAPDVTESVKGEILPFLTLETLRGNNILTNTETTPGQRTLVVVETRSGSTPVLGTEVTRGDNTVFPTVFEVQQIDISGISSSPLGQFQVEYAGEVSALLPKTATATQIDSALEGLATIQALGTTPTQGAVSVTQLSPFIFQITYNVAQDVIGEVSATLIVEEQQRLSLGTLGAVSNAKFDLSFKAVGAATQSTVQLPITATAADIQAALVALPSIGATGVTVTGTSGVFFVNFTTTGNKPSLTSHGYLPETQVIDFGNQPATSDIQLGYGGVFTSVPGGSSLATIAAALNNLPTVKATGTGNTGAVTVVAGGGTSGQITFNTLGDKLPVYAEVLRNEQQTLDLGRTGVAPTGEYFFNVTHNVRVIEGTTGVSNQLDVNDTLQGSIALVPTSTVTDGSPVLKEVQDLDLSSLIRVPSGVFTLSFSGITTAFLPSTITVGALQTALSGLSSITTAGGVVVAAGTNPNTFLITFNANGNRADIIAKGGAREVQSIDRDILPTVPGGEFTLGFLGDTTSPLPANATIAEVDAALELLPSVVALTAATTTGVTGKVTVTQTGGLYNVQFNDFGDVARIEAQGGGTVDHERQLLDLTKFVGVANTSYALDFGVGRTTALTGTSTASDIQNALNALQSIKDIRGVGGGGAVVVTETAPGSKIFNVDFNVFGDQAAIVGSGKVNGGQTARLPFNATAAQIEAALDAFSVTDVTVTGLVTAGTFNVDFNENADQPVLSVTGFIHEKQSLDILTTGNFTVRFGSDVTVTLPPNAPVATVQAAINNLPSIKALAPGNTGSVVVTASGNSQYDIVFSGDGDINVASGTQSIPLQVTLVRDGTSALTELQRVNYLAKGNFDPATFLTVNIVGAISDSNEIGANVFKFTEVNGTPGFNLGDIPIDGLIMAKSFDQRLVNFTPEARLTAGGFFDNDNFI